MSLVTSMALKATQGSPPFKYLGVINDGSQNQGYLEYSTPEVLTKNAKFAVEYAFDDFVHIRSFLTNKYWVRSSTDGNWIVAQAVQPVVNKTSWTCTLFRMDINDKKEAKFYHVQSGRTIRILNDGSVRNMFLTIDPAAKTEALSIVVDYDTLVVLPKFVAFKGSNGLYYKNYSDGDGDDEYARFSVSDIGNPDIVCEIRYSSDGHIRVRAVKGDMFWENAGANEDNLIVWDIDVPDSVDQMFAAIKVDKNVVALRSLSNNKICKIGDAPHSRSKTLRLVATADGMFRDTYLEVVEPSLRRTVNVYEFDLDKARIYDVSLLYSDEHVWDNPSDVAQSGAANGTITTTKSRTYSNNINVSGTVSTTFETGVPFLVSGEIQVSATAGYEHQWDNTTEESQQIGDTFTVVVQPMKRTIARGVATKGKCDVPFSYVQKDYPANGGDPIVTKLHDGVFTGANAYSFQHEVRYEELPPAKVLTRQAVTKFIRRPVKI